MKYQVHVFDSDDHYEVTMLGLQVLRVTKYIGESELRRDLAFEDLPRHIRLSIYDKILNCNEDE